MLTYATIFIASIILALTVLVFYKLVIAPTKSILSSRGPVSIISNTPNPQKGRAPFTTTGVPAPTGQKSHVTPAHIARTHPAMPSEKVTWGWQAQGNQVRERRPHQGTGANNTRHCSLYDVDSAASKNPGVGWLHREDKLETGGKSYKVTRKVATRTSSTEDSSKPWGW